MNAFNKITGKALGFALLGLGMVVSRDVYAAPNEVSITSEGLEAHCRYYGNEVVVTKNGDEIYKTSYYWSGPESCVDDSIRLNAVFSGARALGKGLKFKNTNSPLSDFKIAAENGGNALVSPNDLSFDCDNVSDMGSYKRLVARSGGEPIYSTSTYHGLGDCPGDLETLRIMRNAAKASHKMIQFRPGDSPGSDFEQSNVDDTSTSQRGNRHESSAAHPSVS